MAQLPNPSDINRQSLTVGPAARSYDSGVQGAAVAQVGADLANAGKAIKAYTDDIDQTVAREAAINATKELNVLEYGGDEKESGYVSYKGKAAVVPPEGGEGLIPTYVSKATALKERHAANLSGSQRKLFDEYTSPKLLAFEAGLRQHSARELSTFKAQQADSEIKLAVEEANFSRANPEAVEMHLASIRGVAQRNAAEIGDEAATVLKRTALTQAYSAVIQGLIADKKIGLARTWYEMGIAKEEIVDPDHTLARAVQGAQEDEAAYTIGTGVVDDLRAKDPAWVPNEDDVRRELKKRHPELSPAMMKAALKEAGGAVAIARDGEAARKSSVYALHLNGASVDEIRSSKEFLRLPQNERVQVLETMEGGKRDYTTFSKLTAALYDPDWLTQKTPNEIMLYAFDNRLGTNGAQTLLSAKQAVENGDPKSRIPQVTDDEVNTAFRLAGEDIPKNTRDDKFLAAQWHMNTKLLEFHNANRRKPTPAERAEIMRDTMRDVTIKDNFLWFDKTLPQYDAALRAYQAQNAQ